MNWKKTFVLLTSLAGAASIAIHLINRTIYISSISENILNEADGNYYNWKFGNVFYTKEGKGSPILLIHDLSSCSSGYEWNKIVKSLSKSHTVYTIDLLGCGRSDKPDITYTNFLYVQLLNDFIDTIIKDKTSIITTGISGSFALGACHNKAELIDKLIMINPPSINLISKSPNTRTKLLIKLINYPLIGTLLYNMLNKKKNINNLFENDYYSDTNKIDSKIKKIYYESAHIGNSKSKYLYASLKGNFLTANLPIYMKELNNSIYIINGGNILEQAAISKKYVDILPSIENVTINKTKLLPQLENPEAVIKNINLFLDS